MNLGGGSRAPAPGSASLVDSVVFCRGRLARWEDGFSVFGLFCLDAPRTRELCESVSCFMALVEVPLCSNVSMAVV